MQDTRNYFATLTRRWQVVIAMPILAMLAAAFVTFTIKPTFQATAIIALAPATVSIPTSSQLPPYYLMVDSPRQLPIAYTPTYYIAILNGADVVDQVAPRVPVALVANANDRALIEITARSDDPRIVAETANAWAQIGARRIEQLLLPNGADVAAAQKKLDAAENAIVKFSRENGSDPSDASKHLALNQLQRERDVANQVYREFARDYERATILAGTAYQPRVIAAAIPPAPVAPNLAQNILIGAGLGLIVGIAGAFVLERRESTRAQK